MLIPACDLRDDEACHGWHGDGLSSREAVAGPELPVIVGSGNDRISRPCEHADMRRTTGNLAHIPHAREQRCRARHTRRDCVVRIAELAVAVRAKRQQLLGCTLQVRARA
mgnify:CR=1 FL=1